jgi:hypothetical protein
LEGGKSKGVSSLAAGSELVIFPKEVERVIQLRINWVFAGTASRRATDRQIPEATSRIKVSLSRANWTVVSHTASERAIYFEASIKADRLSLSSVERISQGLADARDALSRIR